MSRIERGPSSSITTRLIALGAAVVVVLSCETRLPTTPGGGGGPSPGQANKAVAPPTALIDSPSTGQDTLINVGDSVYVKVLADGVAPLTSISIGGFSYRGSADLGNLVVVQRYGTVVIPPSGAFRAGLKDTIVRRFLHAVTPVDSTIDSILVIAVVNDSAGNADTVIRRLKPSIGPKITFISPAATDSAAPGFQLTLSTRATHPNGLASLQVTLSSASIWPALGAAPTFTSNFANGPTDTIVSQLATIPAGAPAGSKILITAKAVSTGGQITISTLTVAVQSGTAAPKPRVTQIVPSRLELHDSIKVHATGNGIKQIGIIVKDSLGDTISRAGTVGPGVAHTLIDSVIFAAPLASNGDAYLHMDSLPVSMQGHRLIFTAFAIDGATPPDTGYAVRTVTTPPTATLTNLDTAIVTYGRTFPLPRAGAIGDIAVDPANSGNVFLSNIDFNRLEVWQDASKSFDAVGVAVGSQPWGLSPSITPGKLLVANSGGTNISQVTNIGAASVVNIREDLTQRIRTRGNFIWPIKESNLGSSNYVLEVDAPLLFSDRPRYIGQTANGIIYFSTRVTPTAPSGIVRYVDPSQPFPDNRTFIFGTSGNTDIIYVIDADSVVRHKTFITGLPDTLTLWDHPPGTNAPSDSVRCPSNANADQIACAPGIQNALAAMFVKNGTDASLLTNFIIAGTPDTDFVALSGDRQSIAFGPTANDPGNVMMVTPSVTSPILAQLDLQNNASEKVFGLAIDENGLTVGAHGSQTYYASVDLPFHLRLQGKFASVANGGGIAFHPLANGYNNGGAGYACPANERTSFVASGDSTVQIVDIAHYVARGQLPLKHLLYGPLRAVLPFPSDIAADPTIILKLFGISTSGLVVIDVRQADIQKVQGEC